MSYISQKKRRMSFVLLAVALCTMPVMISAQSNSAAQLVPTLSLLLFSDAGFQHKVLNDTGTTWGGNYPDTNETDCTSNITSPQDCHQGRDFTHNDDSDGHAGFSYTKLSSTGVELDASAASWSCVKDNVTSLVWEVKENMDGEEDATNIHDADNTYFWGGKTHLGTDFGTYYDDWDELVDGSNNASFCGFTDWRVPTFGELRNLANHGRITPSIDTDYFPNTNAAIYWTASPDASSLSRARYGSFDGGLFGIYNRDSAGLVRLVRSGQ